MKGLFIIEKNTLGFLECAEPVLGPYECLVEVGACGICNSTDLKIIEGRFKKGPFPILLGHESAGYIVKLGEKVTSYKEGDLVLRPRLYAKDLSIPGCVRFGGFSQFAVVTDVWAKQQMPYNSFSHPQQKVPKGISEPYATALITLKENLNTVKKINIQLGESLAIVGTGPVAQSMVACAKLLGIAPVVVFGRHDMWAEKFSKLGADLYVSGMNYPDEVHRILVNGGFNHVLEAVGSNDALKKCLEIVKDDGTVHIYGVPADDEPFVSTYSLDPRVSMVKVIEAEAHDEILKWIDEGRLNLDEWVSHILPWSDYKNAFDLVSTRKADKVVLNID